jgi:hypothetical protein
MPIAELLRALEAEAEAERAAVLADARREAARIEAEAAASADAADTRTIAAHEASRRAAGAERTRQARRAAAREVSRVREAMVERVLAAAASRLPAACTPAVLERLVREAAWYVSGSVELSCRPAAIEGVRAIAADVPELRDGRVVADPAAPTGVLAICDAGALVVEASLEALLRQGRAEIAAELCARVDAEAGP